MREYGVGKLRSAVFGQNRARHRRDFHNIRPDESPLLYGSFDKLYPILPFKPSLHRRAGPRHMRRIKTVDIDGDVNILGFNRL